MKAIRRRLNALESSVPAVGSGVVALRDGEAFEDAAVRLNLPEGGYIVVREMMSQESWNLVARAQQDSLSQG